jgi:hydrogenase 3 maturation protease
VSDYSETLEELAGRAGGKISRLAVLGVGNELNGDDAAGVLAARRLKARWETSTAAVMVVEAGPSPENFTGPLRRFRPDLVLMIDAAEMGEPPGTVRWLGWWAAEGMGASTHTFSPSIVASFLVRELGCQVTLAGIQPASLDFGRPVSAAVDAAVDAVVEEIAAWFPIAS